MELKDQILQTKERKKGFLKSMPDTMRTQINTYAKLDKLAKRFWIYPVAGLILSVAVYLVACLVATPENRWVVHAILAALWIVAGVFVGLRLKSAADKAKKAIMLGAPDYVEELNAINSKLDGLEKAEKARVEAEAHATINGEESTVTSISDHPLSRSEVRDLLGNDFLLNSVMPSEDWGYLVTLENPESIGDIAQGDIVMVSIDTQRESVASIMLG